MGDDETDRTQDGEGQGDGVTSADDVREWEFADPQSRGATAGDEDTGGAPLGDLADRLRRREERDSTDGDSTAGDPDPFEEVPVSEVDAEAVWAALETESTDDVATSSREDPLAPDSVVERVTPDDAAATTPDYLVPKRDFCHQCPHFSAPPDVSCSHEGTAIVEVADHDHFRVRNCPVVEDGDSLGRGASQ